MMTKINFSGEQSDVLRNLLNCFPWLFTFWQHLIQAERGVQHIGCCQPSWWELQPQQKSNGKHRSSRLSPLQVVQTLNKSHITKLKITIPDICHFFTQPHFEASKLYTWKCVNWRKNCLATKQRKIRLCVYALCVKLHYACRSLWKIINCLENTTMCVKLGPGLPSAGWA